MGASLADMGLRREVLEHLRGMGSDLSRPHAFDFYLYFPSQEQAQAAVEKCRERGFRVTVRPAASGDTWLCKPSLTIVPEFAPFDEFSKFFENVAAALSGEFDGWESDVVMKTE